MRHHLLDYEAPARGSLPFRVFGRIALSLPPVWLIVASFMSYADVKLPWPESGYLLLLTLYAFFGSILTLILSVIECLYPDGNAGPFLLHLAAAVIVLIEI